MANKGYLLPGNLEPEDDVCFVVRVPNEIEYIRAFFGAYTQFGLWNVWERTGDNSGSVAASRWRDSIVKSLRVRICCDLVDCLEEDGTLCINVNVNCGCGGGGVSDFNFTINGGGCIPIAPNEVLYSDDIEDVAEEVTQPLDPAGDFPDTIGGNDLSDWDDYSVYICDLAHHLVKITAAGLRELEVQVDRLLTYAGIAAVVAYLTPAGWGAKAGTVAFSELLTALVELLGIEGMADSLSQLADEIESEPTKTEIVCAIYENRYLLPSAHSEFILRLQQAVTDLVFSTETQDALLNLVEKWWPLRYMFKGLIESVLQDITPGQDCSACANAPGTFDHSVDYDFANQVQPWGNTTGVQGHLTPTYSEGHVALISVGGGEATINLDVDGLLESFPGETWDTLELKRVVVYAARAVAEHTNVPYEGSKRTWIYSSGVQNEEHVESYTSMQDDTYTSFQYDGVWPLSSNGTDNVVTIGSIQGGAFQSELKIGHVTLYLDNVTP